MARMLILAVLAIAAATSPMDAAQAQFFTAGQMRAMCRGEVADAPQFRTRAANQLVAESYRSRCRMYLLGVADALLHNEQEGHRCIGAGTAQAEVVEPIVAALLAHDETSQDEIAAIVREVLRSRFGCDWRG